MSVQHTVRARVVATGLLSKLGLICTLACLSGCAGRQYGHLLSSDDKDMVGSHAAGAGTWNPLVDESVAKLLGRCPPPVQTVSYQANGLPNYDPTQVDPSNFDPALGIPVSGSPLAAGPATVCFVGIENKSAEEMLDFKDQLYERIDSQVNSADTFRLISRRMVDAALLETRLRPDSLFLPHNRAAFADALGRQGTLVDYLMYATITSGTTDRNRSSQRDYVLTLEMVNLHTGDSIKESAKLRKGYSKSRAGKWWNYGPFDQADG